MSPIQNSPYRPQTGAITDPSPSPSLARWFWVAVIGLIAYGGAAVNADDLPTQSVGFLIGAVALLPVYCWCTRRVRGLPIFPAFALTHLATYSAPLVFGHPKLARYSAAVAAEAGLTTAMFLAVATTIWYLTVRSAKQAQSYRVLALDPRSGSLFLLLILTGVCGFDMCLEAGWLQLDWTVLSFLRAAMLGLETLAVVGLAYQFGASTLSPPIRLAFIIILATHMIIQTVGLYLSFAFMTTLVGVTAYTTARHKIPVVWLGMVLAIVAALQPGKAEMRAWKWQRDVAVAPWDYPAFYARWVEASSAALSQAEEGGRKSHESNAERASIIHMLMLVQSRSPDPQPFLEGDTYAHIPQLIVPRFLAPDKPKALEGQYIMCVYYGLQTREQTLTTGIAFGMPAEAYANFGYIGILGLAILVGLTHGLVTRYCRQSPVLSLRTLFGFVFTGIFLNGERSTAIVVTSLFQATVVLVIAMYPLMTLVDVCPVSGQGESATGTGGAA